MFGMGGADRPRYSAQSTSTRSRRTPARFSMICGGRRPGGPAYGRAGGPCAHPALGDFGELARKSNVQKKRNLSHGLELWA